MLSRQSSYLAAIGWLLLINLISSLNDAIACFMGQDISPIQITFWRCLVTVLSVLPFMKNHFKTKQPRLHAYRALWGALALGATTFAVVKLPLLKNTCLNFSEPLFMLPLSVLFLHEKLTYGRIICTVLGFCGIFITAYTDLKTWNLWIFVPLLSAFAFSVLNLLAKKMVVHETIPTMLFYFGLGTPLLFLIPALNVWKPLSGMQYGLLTLLGINGNLMQVCMFKAYKLSDVSALMPFRYTEMLFTMLIGFVLFQQVPTFNVLSGGIIIVLSTLILLKHRTKGLITFNFF